MYFFRAISFLGPFNVLFLLFLFQFMMVMWPQACVDHEIELKSEIDGNKYLKDRKWSKAELEFVTPVTHGGSVKILPAV